MSSRRVAWLGSAVLVFLAAILPAAAQQSAAPRRPGSCRISLPAARAEGTLTVFGSMNEQEALPLWKVFQDATGIPVSYIRASDSQLTGRIEIEARTQKNSWDLLVTTGVTRLPPQMLPAIRSAAGAGPHCAGARRRPPMVRRLCQLQRARLQLEFRQGIRAS